MFFKRRLFNRNKRDKTKDLWKAGINEEIKFWRQFVETKGGKWPEQFSFRLDPEAELQPYFTKFLGKPRPISILDAGSGPLTSLGKRWGPHSLNITACDALADYFSKLPLEPLVPVQAIDSENICEYFPQNSFDFAHARNTLDHSYDPLKAVEGLIAVTKKGGVIALLHAAYEATKEGFEGFHQWDFYIRDGYFYMYSDDKEIDVYNKIGDRVEVLETLDDDRAWVVWRKK